MKRVILVLLIVMCVGCNDKKIENSIKDIDDSYIEIVPENSKAFIFNLSDNDILLTIDEIKEYNRLIESKTDYLYNMNITSLSKEKILNYINSYTIPKLPKYNDGKLITNSDINDIFENMNIENVNDTKLLKALVVNRTNLKSFPTELHFFDNMSDTNFDNLQESEMHINTPVLVMHKSKDNRFVFVLTPTYVGWIKEEDIVYVSDEDYDYFINNDKFGIITDPFVEINNKLLDMSVKLPFIETTNDGYKFVIPSKDKNNNLIKEEIILKRDKAHIGYLPYTKRNVYIQAFKYEGIPYSWGSMDYGVDCSSYVSNVYHTFGFIFPRNTSSQNSSVGEVISLNSKTDKEKLDIISGSAPSLLYMDGHVLIYLGMDNQTHYVIGANGGNAFKVVKEELNSSNYLSKINKLVLIKK